MKTSPRIAIVATPRSGNTWLRHLLSASLGLPDIAVHELTPSVIAGLPDRCVLQIHWRRDPAFVALLDRLGFRVVTVARHPFDVLLSILQFCRKEPQTRHWLLGTGGSEASILSAGPSDRQFLDYGTSERAAQLFGVTEDWWPSSGAMQVRYEELVADPQRELGRILGELGVEPVRDLAEVIRIKAFSHLKSVTPNGHYWIGQPGHWRRFLTRTEAEHLAKPRGFSWSELNYSANADENLVPLDAARHWREAMAGSAR